MDLAEVKKFEQQQQKVPITKLSQAIRIGAKIRPQCRGSYFSEGRSCALGAAMEAMDVLSYGALARKLPSISKAEQAFADKFSCGIDTVNDRGWTREEIADELELLGH
jgi:hypothetical protein